jgi:ZU5 domain
MNSLRVFRAVALALTTYLALSCADSFAPTDLLTSGGADAGSGWATGTATIPAACPDNWTTPTFSISGKKVKGARWIEARVPVELSVSGVIGPEGGSLTIPDSQFMIYFPEDALPSPTAITITSKESAWVTYDMYPHGTVFQRPVYVLQGLANTEIFGTLAACSAYGAYLPTGSEAISLDDTATATETTMSYTVSGFNVWTQFLSPQTSIWVINHFSRYMLASG